MLRLIPFLLFLMTKSSAEELFVFSELSLLTLPNPAQLDCGFEVRAQPFASLSPAIAAGETLNLIVVATHIPAAPFVFTVGQNPAATLEIRVRRIFPAWNPYHDPVTVPLPFRGRMPESRPCSLFLVEATAPPALPAGRLKLEPAMWLPDSSLREFWIRYPLEVRILPPRPARDQVGECRDPAGYWENLLARQWSRESGSCLSHEALRQQLETWMTNRRNRARSQ